MQRQTLPRYASSTTTDPIQQYLDENNRLIIAIVDGQNPGNLGDSIRNIKKFQENLAFLIDLADSQPLQLPTTAQCPSNTFVQPGSAYVQPQQAKQYPINGVWQPIFQLIQPQQTTQHPPNTTMQQDAQFMQSQQAQQMNPQFSTVFQAIMLHDQIYKPQLAQQIMLQDQISQPHMTQTTLLHGHICQSQLAQPIMLHDQISQPRLGQPTMLHNQISQPQLARTVVLHDQIPQPQLAPLLVQMEISSGGTDGKNMLQGQTVEDHGMLTVGGFPSVDSSSGRGNILPGTLLSAHRFDSSSGRGNILPGTLLSAHTQSARFVVDPITMPLYLSNSGQEGNWDIGSG